MDIIREKLFLLQDVEYKKFIEKIIPNSDDIIGVRMPILKKLAQQLFRKGMDVPFENRRLLHEEKLLLALLISCQVKTPKDFCLMKKFIPQISNWAVCDTFCTYLKGVRKFPNETFEFLTPYLKSTQEFEVRFALVLLLFHFVEKKYFPFIFKVLDDFNHQGYYAQMGAAWLLSICFIKYPEQTLVYLNESKLDVQTFNRAIQKICESKAVDKKWFSSLKALKKY